MNEITIPSSLDGSPEQSLFYYPQTGTPVPLLVGLHTWSYDKSNQADALLPYCRSRNWALILPEFRGPNLMDNPRARQACASKLAQQDVLDAVNWITANYRIQKSGIFLHGGSGGGHMALMMAANAPALWRGVSSWVPITDLANWRRENPEYAPHIDACCGGSPGVSAMTNREYRERSPLTHAARIAEATVSIHHGRFDSKVPFSHTLRLVQEIEKMNPKRFFYEIFDGGHEIRYDIAFHWFDRLIGRTQTEREATG